MDEERPDDVVTEEHRLKFSIAMCTFNGGRFIAQQLDSIARQTRPPDELVVCDDDSTDDTRAIVEAFAKDVDFPVRLVRNEPRLGVTANFGKAFGLCHGDWILAADQDDIWLPHKLATIEAVIRSRPGVGLVFSDAEIVDENGVSLGYRFSRVQRLGRRLRREVNGPRPWLPFLRQFIAQGAALAFAAPLREVLLPIPPHIISLHDYWIGITLPALRPVHFIAEPLLLYRQHTSQHTGSRIQGLREIGAKAVRAEQAFFHNGARCLMAALERLLSIAPELLLDPVVPTDYAEKIAHHLARSRIRSATFMRLPLATREIIRMRYFKYSSSWRTVISDLLSRRGS